MYPISFFTFKKELVGGPPDWEKERHVETAEKPQRPAPGTVAPLADTLGKRVSKPPEKLIMETEKEAETPSRASKRTIRAPDKFDGDVVQPPPAKQPRLESPGQQQPPQRRPTSDTEAAASPASSSTGSSSGTLKLKTFSKMSVKNQLSGSKLTPAEAEDVVVLDAEEVGHSQGGMTITKVSKNICTTTKKYLLKITCSQVKKAGGAAPSSGQGAAANGGGGGSETINLPGMPTIGPPPLSYGGEDNTSADSDHK